MSDYGTIEEERLRLQRELDSAKSQVDRNRLGQFATPTGLATDILRTAKSLLPKRCAIRFLDPAVGTGAFYSALTRSFSGQRIASAIGYEIDPHYATPAAKLWKAASLQIRVQDFTSASPPEKDAEKPNLIVCNPPYVRHHHVGAEMKQRLRPASAFGLSGLAGLYCHFVSLSHAWMARNALALWLIPSEFMDVNYGTPLKEYLLKRVTLLRIHRFDPAEVQFGDAMVSSAVVCFRNTPPRPENVVRFTYGGSLSRPERTRLLPARELRPEAKWTGLVHSTEAPNGDPSARKLSELFLVKRGIATGANNFFILSNEQALAQGLPKEFLRPILPSPRHLTTDEIEADERGYPLITPRLFLLCCSLPEEEIRRRHPRLWDYLRLGKAQGIHERYLCRHRSPWYCQEERRPAPLLCTYMGRTGEGKGAFRFILNHSCAIPANVYLMLYPRPPLAALLRENPDLLRAVWTALGEISWEALKGVGRVYGGGLHKMEPKELAQAPAETVLAVLPELERTRTRQLSLSL